MNDPPVFRVSYLGDSEFLVAGNDPAGIVDLPSAGRIEGGAIEDYRGTVSSGKFLDFGIEVVEEGIVVVEAVGHGSEFIKNTRECLWGLSPQRPRRYTGECSTRSLDFALATASLRMTTRNTA